MIQLSLAIFAACMVWAAVNDLRTMKIPNLCVLALLATFAVVVVPFSDLTWVALGDHLVVMVGLLVIGFALFMFNVLGAGDGKLMAATALWLGPSASFDFVVYTTALGGLLALGVLMLRGSLLPVRLATHPIIVRMQDNSRTIPYGMAIAPGALLALPSSPWATYLPTAIYG